MLKSGSLHKLSDDQIKKIPVETVLRYNVEGLKYLIKRGFDKNKKSANGYPIIYHAAIKGLYSFVKYLLNIGANANNIKGKPLMAYVENIIQKLAETNSSYKSTMRYKRLNMVRRIINNFNK
jgi:ankyrin repeat protein